MLLCRKLIHRNATCANAVARQRSITIPRRHLAVTPSSVPRIREFGIHNTNRRGANRNDQGALYADSSAFLVASNENIGALCGNIVSILSSTSWPWPGLTLVCQIHWPLWPLPVFVCKVEPTDGHGHGQVQLFFRQGVSSTSFGSETNFLMISGGRECIYWASEKGPRPKLSGLHDSQLPSGCANS